MEKATSLSVIRCLYISSLFIHLSSSSPSRAPIGVHPLDVKYYDAELIKCKDGSKSFTRDRINDDFCDCADGTDEPGTSACPAGKFYCRNTGSTPRFLFSSRVNDHICDCCDGSDEHDGTIFCPNTCIMGGNIVYQRVNYASVARKVMPEIKLDDSPHKIMGLKALSLFQVAVVIVLVVLGLFRRRKSRRRNS